MSRIAVIDTETNWADQVMSVGVVIADSGSLRPLEGKYYILTPEQDLGGMYEDRMDLVEPEKTRICSRQEAMEDLNRFLSGEGVREMFAYNARFDCHHLQELGDYQWYDIMRIAAYRQYNDRISPCAECCSTGRLKRSYGVEPILRCLRQEPSYRETHNALLDALDELQIMELLGKPLALYRQCAAIH